MARYHAGRLALERGVPEEARDRIALVVSELCTNALRYAHALGWPEPRCALTVGVNRWLTEVWDPFPWQDLRAAVAHDKAGDEEESGRGLALVAHLTDNAWGVRPSTRGGKVVWAVVRW
ncbi:ATP-binding protein [Actinocorallia sp. A-T 12471]|uniref:ATP-binding protein n=1 Tax=Actinocorallia sp. A-T 12471 TaxID=3089813 RepID=UPI0029D010B4|nr:ATP-binding protein [Actinocorallia sp. A-T 12471]MDX6743447.1 ATP-binding protein [Actinocorallia sp. A-T 12471]